jgi:hypothetical protein
VTSQAGPRPSPEEVAALADRLTHKILGIASDELRARVAAEELHALSAATAALLLNVMLRRARDLDQAASAMSAIDRALSRGEVDPEFVASTIACARSRADRLVEALLATGPALREYDQNAEQFVDRRMRALTLGEKRALSRSRDIDKLVRLAHDQDPLVIRELLVNPRLTEREAVLVASRRPTHAHVIEAVLRSRFGNSRRVRRAVAHNPYASIAQAVRALATLTTGELRLVAADEHVSAEVRQHAQVLCVGRRTTAKERANAAPLPEPSPADEWVREVGLTAGDEDVDFEIVAVGVDGRPLDF